jgi:hypothetical protein
MRALVVQKGCCTDARVSQTPVLPMTLNHLCRLSCTIGVAPIDAAKLQKRSERVCKGLIFEVGLPRDAKRRTSVPVNEGLDFIIFAMETR